LSGTKLHKREHNLKYFFSGTKLLKVCRVKRLFADPTAGETAPFCRIGPFVIQTYDLLGVEGITAINFELTNEIPNVT
jgi:hypothetical protein